MKKNVKLLGMVAMFSVALASCTNDELKEVYQGEEISFTTRMTRAAETTTENLEAFKVWAHAKGYGEDMFMDGDLATRDGQTSHIFSVSHAGGALFWPSVVDEIDFWAYGPFKKDGTNEQLGSIQADITANSQALNSFVVAPSMTDGGKDHQDLVVAYTKATRTDLTGTTVGLTFQHALSQIEVKAKCPAADKGVKIKGAWLMNVCKGGNLEFSQKDDADNGIIDHMKWNVSTDKTNYGVMISKTTSLLSDPVNLIAGENSSLMLVPQKGAGWNKTTQTGTYILLLCRVEATHEGTAHPGSDDAIKVDGTKHIHQLFPITGEFNEAQYGYTCVAIEPNWVHGKKYVYNLEFCGLKSGAGVYPSIKEDELEELGLPHDVNDIITRPNGKNVGDPVLDKPISFDVAVSEWVDETQDKPMD